MKNLMKIIEVSDGNASGTMVVNKDGIVEYYWPGYRMSGIEAPGFSREVVGKHVLDLYPELTEENSTVMETLRTGKTIVGQKQVLTWKGYTMTLVTTSYPIIEQDRVEGAVDVARILELKKDGVAEQIGEPLYSSADIVTANDDMKALKATIQNVAKGESPVLIYGETGTGKELVAQSLHTESRRAGKPFFSQNCAAIPENLLESIFFGTEKGSFTGAEFKKGIFEMADGGTLFLDEINSMAPAMQAKLLKALEEQKIRRIGGKQDFHFNVRIVCAANEDPELLVKSGALRADLYYRISVVKLVIPPLRERPEDIMLLTEHFIDYYNRKMGRNIRGLNQMARQLFASWSWPGNVRELKNTIESAFNMEQSESITLDSVQELLRKVSGQNGKGARSGSEEQMAVPIPAAWLSGQIGEGKIDLKRLLEECETYVISEVLKKEKTLKDAAQRLCISPQKLQYRLEKLGLREK